MDKGNIHQIRILKEKELLASQHPASFHFEFSEPCNSLELTTEVHGYPITFFIEIPEKYPFEPPKVTLCQNANLATLTEFSSNEDILEQVLGESWLPVKNLGEVSEKLVLYAQQAFKTKDKALIIDLFSMKPSLAFLSVILFSLLIRISVMHLPHEGANQAPFYGEYEAYRNWMAITNQLPLHKWYSYNEHLPLNNPPFNAYFCYFLSFFSQLIDPKAIPLYCSAGYYSTNHKVFMRISVILIEIVSFYIPLFCFFRTYYKNLTVGFKSAGCAIFLISPGFVVIYHLKFSYDFVALGLILWSLLMLMQDFIGLSVIFTVLAVNFKKEAGVFLWPLMTACVLKILQKASYKKRVAKPNLKTFVYVTEMAIGIFHVLFSFCVTELLIWAPWIGNPAGIHQILNNLWSLEAASPANSPIFVYLLKLFLSEQEELEKMLSFLLSLLLSTPFFVFLITKKPFGLSLMYCLTGTGLVFYLFCDKFSENFVAFALFPLALLSIIDFPEIFRAASMVSASSLYLSLIKDGSRSGYFGICLFFLAVTASYTKTVNFFQNRSGLNLQYWYLVLLIVHAIELLSFDYFAVSLKIFNFASFMLLLLWVFCSHKELKEEEHNLHYHVEKRFRNKSKKT